MNVIEEPTEFPPRRYRIARAYLRLWGMPGLTDPVELALTELVTNVHRHVPDRWCTVTLLRTDDGVRIEVYDRSPAAPTHRTATEWDESGRGLSLITLLTDKWDITPSSTGKTVWCEIAPCSP